MIIWLEKKRAFSLMLVVLVAIEIFLFSSISGGSDAPASNMPDMSVVYHFSVFFLLNFFVLVSLNGKKNLRLKFIFIAIALSATYSILDEVHQLFVPFRHPDLIDILTNNAGIFLSSLVYAYSKK